MKHLTCAALIPLMGTAAFAGNLDPVPVETPPAPVIVQQTPVYNWSGAYIGAQGSYADVDTSGAADFDGDGGLYGLRAGYDLQRGSQVFGGVLHYDLGSIGLEETGIEIEDILRVGGRYGITTGAALYYGTAGFARAETNTVGSADGLFAGIGYERFVTDNVTLGAEVLYHDLDAFDGAPGVDAEATTVGLTVNYRF